MDIYDIKSVTKYSYKTQKASNGPVVSKSLSDWLDWVIQNLFNIILSILQGLEQVLRNYLAPGTRGCSTPPPPPPNKNNNNSTNLKGAEKAVILKWGLFIIFIISVFHLFLLIFFFFLFFFILFLFFYFFIYLFHLSIYYYYFIYLFFFFLLLSTPSQ